MASPLLALLVYLLLRQELQHSPDDLGRDPMERQLNAWLEPAIGGPDKLDYYVLRLS
jgi:hypothetical protein